MATEQDATSKPPFKSFPINGKIKTADQKVNCLIQSTLGSLTIVDFTLNQDVTKIFRAGQRITRCLTELQMLKNDFMSLQNSVILAKCMRARLWENSKFVSRQLEKIGPMLSTMMVNAGLTTFKKIEETNPREIEMIVNRHPPFGSQIRETASNLPKYELSVQQAGRHQPNRAEIVVTVTMANYIKRKEAISSERNSHFCLLLIANADNKVVFKQRLGDAVFMKEGYWSKRVDIQRATVQSTELSIHLISQEYVGLDVSTTYSPYYHGNQPYLTMKREPQASTAQSARRGTSNSDSETTRSSILKAGVPRVPCSHRCFNKEVCGHDCCKQGVISKAKKNKPEMEQSNEPKRLPLKITTKTTNKDAAALKNVEAGEQSCMDSFLRNLHQRAQAIPGTPAAKRLKMSAPEMKGTNVVDLTLTKRFSYTRKTPIKHEVDTCGAKSEVGGSASKRDPGRSCWEEIDWHKRRLEKQQATTDDSTNDDCFDDELPCFSVDELWNDDELALALSDENDLFASPAVQCSQQNGQNGQNPSHSHYLKPTASDRSLRNSCEFKQPLSRSSQFIIGSQAKKATGISATSAASSQSKENPRRISHPLPPLPPTPGSNNFEIITPSKNSRRISRPLPPPPPTPGADYFELPYCHGNPRRIAGPLPPPPPTPGADDFELPYCHGNPRRITRHLPEPPPTSSASVFEQTSHPECATRANNTKWTAHSDDEVNLVTTGTSHLHDWSSLKEDILPDELDTEDWDIFLDVTRPRSQRSNSIVSQKEQISTNLTSKISSTSLDPIVMEETEKKSGISLKQNRALAVDDDFRAEGSMQSQIPSSFFCSKSFTSSEQDHEEQDAFAGIFQGLL